MKLAEYLPDLAFDRPVTEDLPEPAFDCPLTEYLPDLALDGPLRWIFESTNPRPKKHHHLHHHHRPNRKTRSREEILAHIGKVAIFPDERKKRIRFPLTFII